MEYTNTEEYYDNNQLSFTDAFAIAKYKMLSNIPMSTAAEELMEDFIKEWVDLFGYETLN